MDRPSPDTIFALSTAPGKAGIAIVRVSGPGASKVAHAMIGVDLVPRVATLATIIDPATGDEIDEAISVFFRAPASFTGEDLVEFHVHGGRAVVAALLGAIGAQSGLRPAQAGEFTRRAFEAGRLDLTRVEGLAALIDSETEAQRQAALAHFSGHLADQTSRWRASIIEAMALVEAGLDFSDEEDVDQANLVPEARDRLRPTLDDMQRALGTAHRGEILKNGYVVAVTGPVNAGKSTLLNMLAQRDVAIVSEEPGTTRDVVEVCLDLGGIPVRFQDTAGIRETEGAVEREGIRRSRAAAAEADLVLWLSPRDHPVDPDAELTDGMTSELLVIDSKADLCVSSDVSGAATTSVHDPQSIGALIELIAARARNAFAEGVVPDIANDRHRHEISAACQAISDFMTARDGNPPELLAEDLRRAGAALGRLIGRVDIDDVLDQVFAGFCIGK